MSDLSRYEKDPRKWEYGYADRLISNLRYYENERQKAINVYNSPKALYPSRSKRKSYLVIWRACNPFKSIRKTTKIFKPSILISPIQKRIWFDSVWPPLIIPFLLEREKKDHEVEECIQQLEKWRLNKAQRQAKIVQERKEHLSDLKYVVWIRGQSLVPMRPKPKKPSFVIFVVALCPSWIVICIVFMVILYR